MCENSPCDDCEAFINSEKNCEKCPISGFITEILNDDKIPDGLMAEWENWTETFIVKGEGEMEKVLNTFPEDGEMYILCPKCNYDVWVNKKGFEEHPDPPTICDKCGFDPLNKTEMLKEER